MAQTITLTASMRSNLASLKSIQSQMDTTQERLSTGKKVNSAIDNASSFYQARALTNRAGDLDALLDSMGQGIQTIEAANEGIEAVTSYVEQLKSVAESAYALDPALDSYAEQIASYQKQFATIQDEITKLVNDASYQGINLLKGGKLTVTFNETRSNKFVIQGENIIEEMNIGSADDWAYEGDVVTNATAAEAIEISPAVTIATGAQMMSTDPATPGDLYVMASDGKYYQVNTAGTALEGAATPYDGDVSQLKEVTGGAVQTMQQKVDVADAVEVAAGTELYILNGQTIAKGDDDNWYNVTSKAQVATGAGVPADATVKQTGGSYATSIDATITEIANATDYLRSYATELGNNYSIIETRQNFTDALIDVLETGSDNLVLADMNEESANYLALQTRQQLAINSLSLASQSAQSILSLFQ